MKNTVITKKHRENLVKASAGERVLPKIVGMAFGDGGCSGGEVVPPDENQAALRHELYRKPIDQYRFIDDTTCRYKCVLSETELANETISEIGLYDENEDIVCIKTFAEKGKDDDLEMTFFIDDKF